MVVDEILYTRGRHQRYQTVGNMALNYYYCREQFAEKYYCCCSIVTISVLDISKLTYSTTRIPRVVVKTVRCTIVAIERQLQ